MNYLPRASQWGIFAAFPDRLHADRQCFTKDEKMGLSFKREGISVTDLDSHTNALWLAATTLLHGRQEHHHDKLRKDKHGKSKNLWRIKYQEYVENRGHPRWS